MVKRINYVGDKSLLTGASYFYTMDSVFVVMLRIFSFCLKLGQFTNAIFLCNFCRRRKPAAISVRFGRDLSPRYHRGNWVENCGKSQQISHPNHTEIATCLPYQKSCIGEREKKSMCNSTCFSVPPCRFLLSAVN